MDLKKGEVVRLKSGGPSMTVESVDNTVPGVTYINCIWFSDKNHSAPSEHMFEIELLSKTAPSQDGLDF